MTVYRSRWVATGETPGQPSIEPERPDQVRGYVYELPRAAQSGEDRAPNASQRWAS